VDVSSCEIDDEDASNTTFRPGKFPLQEVTYVKRWLLWMGIVSALSVCSMSAFAEDDIPYPAEGLKDCRRRQDKSFPELSANLAAMCKGFLGGVMLSWNEITPPVERPKGLALDSDMPGLRKYRLPKTLRAEELISLVLARVRFREDVPADLEIRRVLGVLFPVSD
jgi:hypothetical protein